MRTDHTRRELLTYGLGAAGLAATSIAGFNWWNHESQARAAAEAAHSATAQAQASASSQAAATMRASADAHASWKAQRFSGGSKAPEGEYRAADNQGPAQNVPVPVPPQEVDIEDQNKLLEFLNYWVQLHNYAYQTGDTQKLANRTSNSYTSIKETCFNLDYLYRNEGWVVGGTLQATFFPNTLHSPGEHRYTILAQVVPDDAVYFDIVNDKVKHVDMSAYRNRYVEMGIVFHKSGKWVVSGGEYREAGK